MELHQSGRSLVPNFVVLSLFLFFVILRIILLQSLQIIPLHPCTIFSQIFVIDFKSVQYVSLQITVSTGLSTQQCSEYPVLSIFSIQFLYFFIHFCSEENSTFLHSFCWHSLYIHQLCNLPLFYSHEGQKFQLTFNEPAGCRSSTFKKLSSTVRSENALPKSCTN